MCFVSLLFKGYSSKEINSSGFYYFEPNAISVCFLVCKSVNRKFRILEILVIARLAHFSLAKTFLQSYQGISENFKSWNKVYSNFYGYKFIIHQILYLGKRRSLWTYFPNPWVAHGIHKSPILWIPLHPSFLASSIALAFVG